MQIIQYLPTNTPEDIYPLYKACCDQVKATRPKKVKYSLLSVNPYPELEVGDDYRFQSDLIRLRLSIDNPDMLWIDADAEIEKWWVPEDGNIPHFFNCGGGFAEICVFYVNNNISLFQKLWDIYVNRKSPFRVGWIQGVLNSTSHANYKYIPPHKFIHKAFSRMMLK